MKENKRILAYRKKQDVKHYTKKIFKLLSICILSLITAVLIILFVNTRNNWFVKKLVILTFVFVAIVAVYLITVNNKLRKEAIKNNELPQEAIYYENGCIYIQEKELIKIDCLKIEKVNEINNTKLKFDYGIQEFKKEPDGHIVIILNDDERYMVKNLKDVAKVKEEILKLIK